MMNKLRDIMFLEVAESWYHNITVHLSVDFEKLEFEDSQKQFKSVRVISNSNLEGQQDHNVKEFKMQTFDIQHNILEHLMRRYWKGDMENNKLVPLNI